MNAEHYIVPARTGVLNKIFIRYPLLEVISKIAYWNIVKILPFNVVLYLKKIKYNDLVRKNDEKVHLHELSSFLKNIGVDQGKTIVVHSSYDSLKVMKVLPRDIVNMLIDLIGHKGNLVMPANRVHDYSENPVIHDINMNKIWSGALPFAVFLNKSSIKSKMPINSIVSLGPDSEYFVCNELERDDETPCGMTSAWYKILLKQGIVLGLGVDLVHNLTMTHVVEDCWTDEWPSKNWYEQVTYRVIDKDYDRQVSILQRKESIGKYYYMESKLAHDLELNGILRAFNYKGISIQILNSVDLVKYLRSKRPSLYPFYDNIILQKLW